MANVPENQPDSNRVALVRAHVDCGDAHWFTLHPGEHIRDRHALADEFAPELPTHPEWRVQVHLLPDGRLVRRFYCAELAS